MNWMINMVGAIFLICLVVGFVFYISDDQY